uniref:7TM_GPCR_Srx domain-containing protein n=1 Tax=Steinernema glaseri TaxID=37863 RepID=A0A1I7Y309_9BILA
MNASTFVYGSELQGRGYTTSTDLAFGSLTTIIGLVAFMGGILNLYLIKNVKAFRSAFGFFWAARTVGELGNEFVYAAYTGPVTILQPANIPGHIGVFFYHFGFAFTYIQCVMHWAVALNRLVAVWLPIYYRRIFSKRLCVIVVLVICIKALMVISLYFIFPCNHIGYSPRFHENVFVKCSPELDRDFSLIAPTLYKTCFAVACAGTAVINLITFVKIAYIRATSQAVYNQKEFQKDVRLFFLGVVQDVVMTSVVATVIFCNNDKNASDLGILLSYDGIVFIYIVNTLSMVFFNRECRSYLFGKIRRAHVTSTASGTFMKDTSQKN